MRGRFVGAMRVGIACLLVAAGLGSCAIVPVSSVGPTGPPAGTTAPKPSPSLDLARPSALAPAAAASSPVAFEARSHAVATRVVVAELGIDLPIVEAPMTGDAYPYCNVAMYLPQLHQPGEAGATYLFAHARAGMFLRILDESKVNDGAAMKGMAVSVYTSDDRVFTYEIRQVRRHVLTLGQALAETHAALYLQTSEGPHGTPQKLQVVASLLSSRPVPRAEAHPKARPVECG
jgi:sortase (surface protein transpeptidase)